MLFAVMASVAAVAGPTLTGLPIDILARYISAIDESAGTFKCLDGSGTIPIASINDNYRDCEDGSDEPSMSEGPTEWAFVCSNAGHMPKEIQRWSVGDRICDCCDGSDELAGVCPNTCAELETEREVLIDELRTGYWDGMTKRTQMEAEGVSILANKDTDILEFEMKIEEVQEEIKILDESNETESNDNLTTVQRFFVDCWQFTFGISDDEHPYPIVKSKTRADEIADLHRAVRDHEREIETIKKGITGVPKAMLALAGRELESGKYKLKLFDEVRMGSDSCGKFNKIEDNVIMFDGGRHCWETRKGRSTNVTMVCANETRILDVMETSWCEHSLILGCPYACSQTDVDALQNLTVIELRELSLLNENKTVDTH